MNVFKFLGCILSLGHEWKRLNSFFYCIDEYPKFVKLWQDRYACKICEYKYNPEFFNKNWRVKHRFVNFNDKDILLNLSVDEARSYKLTKIIIKILDKKQGVTDESSK